MNLDSVRESYLDLLGQVPETLEKRLALAAQAGRISAIAVIEAFREELLHRNPLDRKTQQLIHFAMLIAANEMSPALLHAKAAIKAGASAAPPRMCLACPRLDGDIDAARIRQPHDFLH